MVGEERRLLRNSMAALTDQAPWTHPGLEREFLELIRTAGLPEPQVNVIVDGFLVDCFWPEHNLVVELDGYRTHLTRRAFEDDRRRDAAHAVAGRRHLRVSRTRVKEERPALQADMEHLLEAKP